MEAAIAELRATTAELRRTTATRSFILGCSLVTAMANMVLYILVRLVFGPFASLPERPAPAPTQASGNTVTIGSTDATPESRKTYLTTADLAARENLAERTVVKYISEGRVTPPPVKDGKAYRIAAEYRILPQSAE